MDVSQMLSHTARKMESHPDFTENARFSRSYTTRQASTPRESEDGRMLDSKSTRRQAPKEIICKLVLSEAYARLPLRVQVHPHDSTESITSTVKNFYGLAEGSRVSFEDGQGLAIVPQYENLASNATIHIRVHEEKLAQSQPYNGQTWDSNNVSPEKPRLDEPFQMLPPQQPSRPSSRTAHLRSTSPQPSRSRRSGSARALAFPESHSQERQLDFDAVNGLSDSDAVSVSSSRRNKGDSLASAEISVDNIVEGNRRKRAKFESSELPLFNPPQMTMPASISSASPQRRVMNLYPASPPNNLRAFALPQPFPSPVSHATTERSYGFGMSGKPASLNGQPQQKNKPQGHGSGFAQPGRSYSGNAVGILPTPDPTVGSAISDEDVALQLMRLGDASNFSHGRTSTSTMDDALSGKAEAASSGENSEDSGEENGTAGNRYGRLGGSHARSHKGGPARKKLKSLNTSIPQLDTAYTSEDEYEGSRVSKHQHSQSRATSGSNPGAQRSSGKKSRQPSSSKVPQSPYSAPASNRKGSTASSVQMQALYGDDEDEDLSSKPRCQRCRKSKKGCDRQRPCQRCKDAGIGADGCISEDEGNGRKGRYGRHMGVSVKKESLAGSPTESPLPKAMSDYQVEVDGSKKRKR